MGGRCASADAYGDAAAAEIFAGLAAVDDLLHASDDEESDDDDDDDDHPAPGGVRV
jgi:hypothetical protein